MGMERNEMDKTTKFTPGDRAALESICRSMGSCEVHDAIKAIVASHDGLYAALEEIEEMVRVGRSDQSIGAKARAALAEARGGK